MKNQKQLITHKCPGCSHEFTSPMNLFCLPDDLDLLAKSLELPAATVTTMLDRAEILVRRWVDKNGRPHRKESSAVR